jgi:protocatechuate 3,4-dioxygenase beta subunit
VPFSLTLYVYDAKNSCAALQNVQVDIWHCNAAGVYSGIQSSTNGTALTTPARAGCEVIS